LSGRVRPHPLRWAPPFLVGVAAATAAEVALGLLLYDGPGLMRSLTTVLVVEAMALAVGLWGAPGHDDDVVESLRRRWLFCTVIYLVATLFSASWSLVEGLGGGALGQGLGLAALGALPLYGCGSVLAGMTAVDARSPGPSDALGGPTALGAALGFLGTGMGLPRLLTPASLFLTCLVLLSAAGLIYGSVLDRKLPDEDDPAEDDPVEDDQAESDQAADDQDGAAVQEGGAGPVEEPTGLAGSAVAVGGAPEGDDRRRGPAVEDRPSSRPTGLSRGTESREPAPPGPGPERRGTPGGEEVP